MSRACWSSQSWSGRSSAGCPDSHRNSGDRRIRACRAAAPLGQFPQVGPAGFHSEPELPALSVWSISRRLTAGLADHHNRIRCTANRHSRVRVVAPCAWIADETLWVGVWRDLTPIACRRGTQRWGQAPNWCWQEAVARPTGSMMERARSRRPPRVETSWTRWTAPGPRVRSTRIHRQARAHSNASVVRQKSR
jgi:hypothetical protein